MTNDNKSPSSFSAFIPIEPFPKERPEFIRFKNKTNGRYHRSARTRPRTLQYETALKTALMNIWGTNTPPIKGSLFVEIWCYLTRPKSVSKSRLFPFKKPDLDNLEKAILDSLDFTINKAKFGGIIENDSRVVSKVTHKRYTESNHLYGQQRGVLIRIFALEKEDDLFKYFPTQSGVMVIMPEAAVQNKEIITALLLKILNNRQYPIIIPGGIPVDVRKKMIQEGQYFVKKYCILEIGAEKNTLENFVADLASSKNQEFFKASVLF